MKVWQFGAVLRRTQAPDDLTQTFVDNRRNISHVVCIPADQGDKQSPEDIHMYFETPFSVSITVD